MTTYFAITSHLGRETPCKLYDIIPASHSTTITYCTKLREDLAVLPLDKLFAMYKHLKSINKLPPEDRG